MADPRRFPRVVIAVTLTGLVVPAVVAPGRGLAWLLFVGSSVHVAATFALFAFADVRRHARGHPRRYVAAPLLLIVTAGAAAALLPARALGIAVSGVLGWQLWHYQQQNLGLAALAARATGQPPLTTTERRCIRASATAAILGLAAHPNVTQFVDARPPAALTAVALGVAWLIVAAALATVARQRRTPAASTGVLVLAVAYPLPLLLATSPYAALGGMTLAHGLQYLLLVGLVLAGPPRTKTRLVPEAALVTAGVLAIAGALATASHLHNGPAATRAIFGAYLGVVMTHFVLDAGLWRLRDPFPRQWLGKRLPTLLAGAPAADIGSRTWPARGSATSAGTPARRPSSSPASPKALSTGTR